MQTLIQEKVSQAIGILQEKNIDLWLTFVRETSCTRDPVMDLIYGENDLTWHSALILTKNGERIAIVGRGEAEAAELTGAYTTVIPYTQSVKEPLLAVLQRLDPQQIAINYSESDYRADGLNHGMFLGLTEILKGTPYFSRLCSAEKIIGALTGRKSPTEIDRIAAAIAVTEEIFQQTFDHAGEGMSEVDISNYMHEQVKARGLKVAWEYEGCPIVNAGPDSPIGHGIPSPDRKIQRGQLLHLDFGIKKDGYCSDIQKMIYFLAPGETKPPEEVTRAFNTIRKAIQLVVENMKPGISGVELDKLARDTVTGAGYAEYTFATGHQLGCLAHDGGTLIGPEWPRYGNTIHGKLEIGQVFTVEPNLVLPGYGIVGLEEDVMVTENGGVYLSVPQEELIVV